MDVGTFLCIERSENRWENHADKMSYIWLFLCEQHLAVIAAKTNQRASLSHPGKKMEFV